MLTISFSRIPEWFVRFHVFNCTPFLCAGAGSGTEGVRHVGGRARTAGLPGVHRGHGEECMACVCVRGGWGGAEGNRA